MKTQSKVDPLSTTEKNLVIGIFIGFLCIIVSAMIPDSLFEWIHTLVESSSSITSP